MVNGIIVDYLPVSRRSICLGEVSRLPASRASAVLSPFKCGISIDGSRASTAPSSLADSVGLALLLLEILGRMLCLDVPCACLLKRTRLRR